MDRGRYSRTVSIWEVIRKSVEGGLEWVKYDRKGRMVVIIGGVWYLVVLNGEPYRKGRLTREQVESYRKLWYKWDAQDKGGVWTCREQGRVFSAIDYKGKEHKVELATAER